MADQLPVHGHCEAILLQDTEFDSAKAPSHIGTVTIRKRQIPDLVQILIPPLLRSGAHAWLLVYAIPTPADGPTDALVIPVTPGQFGLPVEVFLCVERLLEAVYFNLTGESRSRWTPMMGLSSLMDPARIKAFPVRAMALHSDVSLKGVGGHSTVPQHSGTSTAQDGNQSSQAEQIIRTACDKLVRQLRTTAKIADTDEILNAKGTAVREIYEGLKRLGAPDEKPEIVRRYQMTMDPETRKFLVSAATVAAFVQTHPEVAPEFDYSIPGAGLCKAIEREVKRSVAFQLGLNPRDFTIFNVNQLLEGQKVKINKREYNGASIRDAIGRNITPELYAVITDAKGYLKDLDEYRSIRNEVAHIDPVYEERYHELAAHAGLEMSTNIDESVLGRTLQTKQQQRENGITIY